jgi:hypothetical protein
VMTVAIEEIIERVVNASDFSMAGSSDEPLGRIMFTGWKELPSSIELVFQIVWFAPPSAGRGAPSYYINLPNEVGGSFLPGSTFNISNSHDVQPVVNHRVNEPEEIAKRRTMIREGLLKLINIVFDENPEWLEKGLVQPQQLNPIR